MSMNFSDSVTLGYITLAWLAFGINLLPVHDSIPWITCENTGSWCYVDLPNIGQFLYARLEIAFADIATLAKNLSIGVPSSLWGQIQVS